jgi:glutamate-1-semialdehyde aminotransferase
LWERALDLIPTGTQTLSKAPNQFVQGVYPIYLQRGQGSHVWDVDGNEYIDYPLSLGAIFLGHAYPRVNEAIQRQLRDGIIFSLMHPLEVDVADRLKDLIPCAERVRFAKSGSDVTSAAIRVARASTGRTKIAFCGYHGWHDWYAATTARAKGIPTSTRELIFPFQYNDPASLEQVLAEHTGEIAAVIMEPVGLEAPREGFLQRVRELATQYGARLVFDEIVTGFRFDAGGIQKKYGVVPDLATFGKSMANGMPLNVLVGKKEVMAECEEVFFSTTFGGEVLSLAAAMAVLDEMQEQPVVAHIWKQGQRLQDGFNRMAAEKGVAGCFTGFPPRMFPVFKDAQGAVSKLHKSLFWQETVKRGILFGNAQMISFSHTDDDITRTLSACDEALDFVKEADASGEPERFLEGTLPTDIFRKP